MLSEIDPRLIVLAPFTISSEANKIELLSMGRRWKQKIHTAYTGQSVRSALNITGLFIMNRFRDITMEEVIAMLNFDLRDTVAGQQIYDTGHQKGILKEARIMVIEALAERFIKVPSEIKELLFSEGNHEMLKELLRHAIRTPHIEDFKKVLTKALPA